MPKHTLTTTTSYTKLLTSIKREMRSGIASAQKMLEYARLQTYWKVGRHIRHYADGSPEAGILTEKFYQRFSKDLSREGTLEMSADLLKRALQFHKNYPQFPKNTPLTWTHYIALMRVTDGVKRRALERKAIKNNLSCLDLKEQINVLRSADNAVAVSDGALTYERGKPYVYCIRSSANVAGKEDLQVDCGFQIFVEIPKATQTKQQVGRVVRSVKKNGEYSLVADKKGRADLYTYAACVERVVDGDTLDVRIDVGFGIRMKCQRLRLRGINAPESRTAPGQQTKDFLLQYLSKCPIIVIRTIKASGKTSADAKGMFGRWLVDVFVLADCHDPVRIAQDGVYFNQLLLDKGLAKMYR